jgi:uncharacterized membrane protein YfcA
MALVGVSPAVMLGPEVKVISGIAAAFILVNSLAGLLGVMASAPALPSALPYWAVAAVAGGYIGSEYGSKRLGNPAIQRIPAVVLAVAGAKMIATA